MPRKKAFGHMKDEIDVSECMKYREVKTIVDDWMDDYNKERYQSKNEHEFPKTNQKNVLDKGYNLKLLQAVNSYVH